MIEFPRIVKFWYNPNFLAFFALFLLSIPALKSLATPGFYTNHDGETHTARIAQYYQALVDGQIPPRLADTLASGLGSPIFVYIYPLPYLLGSIFHISGFSFTDSFKLMMALGYLASGAFIYLWLKEILENPKAAFLGALFYIWIPYRFLTIYVRGSLSEHLAYTFLPLCFWLLTKLIKTKEIKWVAASALSYACILLSQNLVALITSPLFLGYILILSFFQKSPKSLVLSLVSLAWGVIISQVTYLPSLFERKFIRFDEIIQTAYPDHFTTIKQLIRSPWGYGFDLPGTINDQMSFQIGITHLLVLVAVLLLVTYQIIKIRQLSKEIILVLFFAFAIALSVFLMVKSDFSTYVWQNTKLGHLVDIPWRFLGIIAFSLSFLTAYLVKSKKPGLLFLFLVAFVLIANRNHLRINQSRILDDEFFKNYIGTATQYDEFTPKWRQTTRTPIGFDKDIKVEIVAGEADIKNLNFKSNSINFDAEVKTSPAQVQINKFYFPGWDVTVDGQKLIPFSNLTITDASSLKLEKDRDNSGLMTFSLNGGNHKIAAQFQETPPRSAANYLTLASLILAIGVLLKRAKT